MGMRLVPVLFLLLGGASWSSPEKRGSIEPSLTPEGPSTRPSINRHFLTRSTSKNERVGVGGKSFEALPEQPLQLVRPDPSEHRKLEIVNEHMKHLHYVTNAVAVVTVVGKYHSGKSFLLNQLMGKKNGFGIGPTVRPQTMGIWMWGRPMEMTMTNGDPLSVIFIDTEGFAASNISESYDAKIFAVATLLSSYLLYNSVKIIDQADIDYLELLARRTRLFALRSQITRSRMFDDFNHDLLQFPPLLWVVQDFVHLTEGEESPRDWLHRMMASSSRESASYDISLLGIFESVDCHTLFIPAAKKSLLNDLSSATEEELTPEYKEERDTLLQRLKSQLAPKEKNGKPITGPELASLLEVLVFAANEGSLADVPGRWAAFIEQLHKSSVEDCIIYYESEMDVLFRKHNHGPVNATELELWHQAAEEKSKNLLDKLLFGLHNVTSWAESSLSKTVKEKYAKIYDMNQKKIELRCGEAQRKTELKVEEKLDRLVYPMKSTQLKDLLCEVRSSHLQWYREEVNMLSDHSAFERHLEQLQIGIERIFRSAEMKNNEQLELILKSAIQAAVEVFRKESENTNRIPRTTSALEDVITTATSASLQVYETESEMALGEKLYVVYTGHCKSTLSDEASSLRQDNMDLVRASCQARSAELQGVFRRNTDPKKLSFPLNESELETQLRREREAAFKDYSQTQASYDDMTAFLEVRRELATSLDQVCEERKRQNYQAYIKEVESPLKTAKKSILLSADKFDTEFSLSQYMEKICLLQLDEGKAKMWQKSLKRSIVAHYIKNQPELQEMLRSRKGWWADLKGFLQWLYSFIEAFLDGES